MKVIFLLASLLSYNAFAAEVLICDGQVNVLINPAKKSMDLLDNEGNPTKVTAIKFTQLRNGIHTYSISGKVKFNNQKVNIAVTTRMELLNNLATHRADITLARGRYMSFCNAAQIP